MFAYVFRMMRASTVDALAADYTRTAVLKGLPRGTVLRRHVLPNALVPTLAVLGTQLGWLVGGLVVVETLFRYPGLGSLIQFAAAQRDVPLLAGCAMAVAVVYGVGGLARRPRPDPARPAGAACALAGRSAASPTGRRSRSASR